MKDNKIIIFLMFIFIGLLFVGLIHTTKEAIEEPIEESTRLEIATGSGTCVFLDNEARECIACYAWFLDYPSEDFDRISIDLIVKHTINKYFIRHSYTKFCDSVEENTKELMVIIEDSVFAIQPIGFKLIDLTVTLPENIIYK